MTQTLTFESQVNQLGPLLPGADARARCCPCFRLCHSGTIRFALGLPLLSSQSQLYQPARSPPICTSQRHTLSGGAGRVVAMVAPPSGSGTSSSPGVGPHGLVMCRAPGGSSDRSSSVRDYRRAESCVTMSRGPSVSRERESRTHGPERGDGETGPAGCAPDYQWMTGDRLCEFCAG
jgi:hypothetical protein